MLEGQTISHYRVLQRLGNGAMGVVCKAEDLRLNRYVALKYLAHELVHDRNSKDRLLAEARSASLLDHPNVCTIHEVEETEDGQIVLVMAYYDGETLASRIATGGPLPLPLALDIATQLLSGLHHAHEHGIIHRDVKPSNIMISRQNQIKIVDFGLAKSASLDHGLTQTGAMVGTVCYLSPEQVLCKAVDHRADLWASGVVLYEMLSGTLPFSGDTPYSMFQAIMHDTPKSVLEHRPDLPEDAHHVIERALQKEAARRYQSALEFQSDLNALRQDRSLSTSSVSVPHAAARNDNSIVVLPFSSVDANEDTAYFCYGLTDEVITDLSSVHTLRVICLTSAMRLKGTTEPPQKIARDLNVRYVLEGSVRTAGGGVRVSAKLVDPSNGSLLWAEKFNGTLRDVFAIQESISRQIVSALKLQLSPSEEKQILARPIQDVQAYQYYLKAKHEILKYSREGLDNALEFLDMGERLIGKNALLLSAKGQVYWQYVNGGISSDTEYLQKAKICANEALELEPNSAHALRLLGLISVQCGQSQEAVRLLKQALAADPNDPDSLSWYSAVCGLSGKAYAAMPLAKRIMEIDPLTTVYRFIPGLLSLMAGQFSDALPPFEDAIRTDPTNCMLRMVRCQILAIIGRTAEAEEELLSLQKARPENFFAQLGALMRAALMNEKELAANIATESLNEIAACDPHYAWNMAECYSLLGQGTESLQWLEIAVDKGFINYPMIQHLDPLLQNVRREKGFSVVNQKARERWEAFEV